MGTATVASSLPDEERPVLTKPLILNPDEKVMDAGRSIDSTLPINYEVSEQQDQEFRRPNVQHPAWKKRQEFIKKLDGSRLLIVRAPTGSGENYSIPSFSRKSDSETLWACVLHPSKACYHPRSLQRNKENVGNFAR